MVSIKMSRFDNFRAAAVSAVTSNEHAEGTKDRVLSSFTNNLNNGLL